ncbi:MAG: type II toxin-antitoxin system VapC family toxin [Terriglobales bacterium]
MIAVDTNILVYAFRDDFPWHSAARAELGKLAGGPEDWAIPWPCVHEFLAVVTNPRTFRDPAPLQAGLDALEGWRGAANLLFLGEVDGYWQRFLASAIGGSVRGALVHDAHIAALCDLHGVRELWTADRDFSRFPSLRCRNPLVG